VLFHSRLTEELPAGEAFGIDDVATDLADKLVRRHPHVFGDHRAEPAHTAEVLNERWERQKAAEKGRTSATDGVPLGQPSLALAAKLVSRARRADLDVAVPADGWGARMMALVEDAVASGTDPESALRASALAYREAMIAAEAAPSPRAES
jgi:XTP/dITP diphosphohydrolase